MSQRIAHVARALAAVVLAGVFAAGHAAAPSAPQPTPQAPTPGASVVPRSLEVQGGALIAPGKAPEVDILSTGDVIGYIEPCG